VNFEMLTEGTQLLVQPIMIRRTGRQGAINRVPNLGPDVEQFVEQGSGIIRALLINLHGFNTASLTEHVRRAVVDQAIENLATVTVTQTVLNSSHHSSILAPSREC
jgi:hypothetical protein